MKCYLPILFLFISIPGFASDSAHIRFIFASPLNAGKFQIIINDGINEHKIDTQDWKGELFSPFGHALIMYPNSDTTNIPKRLFFKKGASKVYVISSPDKDEYYTIDESASVNTIPYAEMGGASYDEFTKKANDTLWAFYHQNKKSLSDPVINQAAFALSDSLTARKIAFIRQFPDLYISFWTFVKEAVKTKLLAPQELMEIYNRFPDKYKKDKAAAYAFSLIQNKIAIASKGNFPDFSVTDLDNNRIELSKLKGRYVLIQFWASWCKPCLEEVPALKEINDRYRDQPFTLISFSIDKDSLACRKAIEKNGMNWPQVYGDLRLYNAMAYFPIPQLYLIDKTGRTIYNRATYNDIDLVLLKKLLSEQLPK